jgi:hypothetical protein
MTAIETTPDGEHSGFGVAIPTGQVVFDSVEQMLAPTSLSELLGTPIASVSVAPLESNGFSANELSYVRAGDHRLVLKRLSTDDWLTRATKDERCRSLAVWRTGLLDRLEPQLRHGVVAGSRDGADCALLMRDVSAGLYPGGRSLTRVDTRDRRTERLLAALAVMHARFWGDDTLEDPAHELADVETLLTMLWPASWPVMESHPDALRMVQQGWQALLDLVDRDVRATIEQVMAEPGPLVDALAADPATLLHGDYRLDNVAVLADNSVVAFDWQFAGRGPGVMDLAWLVQSAGVFEYRGWAFDCYRDALVEALDGELDLTRWDRALAIARFAHVLRVGCIPAWFSVQGEEQAYNRGKVATFNDTVRRGADLL